MKIHISVVIIQYSSSVQNPPRYKTLVHVSPGHSLVALSRQLLSSVSVDLSLSDSVVTLLVDEAVAEYKDKGSDDTGADETKLETVAQLVARTILLSVEVGCHSL